MRADLARSAAQADNVQQNPPGEIWADGTEGEGAGMSDDGMQWEDPPETSGNRLRWGEALEKLKAYPGRWAMVREFKAAAVASSAVCDKRLRYSGFEFVSRGTRVYARWNPPSE